MGFRVQGRDVEPIMSRSESLLKGFVFLSRLALSRSGQVTFQGFDMEVRSILGVSGCQASIIA